jgi:hypothetical protein
MLFKLFGHSVIKKVFVDYGFYELQNVNSSPYSDCNNHDKLNKTFKYMILS